MIISYVTFILEDPNYYNVSSDELAGQLGKINSIAEIAVIIQDFYMGLIFDAFGRKVPLIIGICIISICIFCIPLFSTLIPAYCILRILIGLGIIIALNVPLLPDYIQKNS